MANPQTENGYTRISNEILDALVKINIGGKKQQLLWLIIRKTYGFHKKQDRISLTQFSKHTEMEMRDVCRCLKQLETMKIIIKIKNNKGNVYSLNKDYDQWTEMTVVKNDNGQKRPSTTDKIVHQPLTKLSHTKDTLTKDNNTKEKATPKRREDIDILLKGIRDITGIVDGSQKEQRNFAKNFLDFKTPEILRRSGNLNPTQQQVINATLRLFQLAKKDSFHQKNCTSLKYVYNKAGAIVMSAQSNKPKIAIIS
jgi:phage replication O-like protein O